MDSVITLQMERDAALAEVSRLQAALTSVEVMTASPPVHVIDESQDLTPREHEALTCVMAGDSNKEIARRMYVAENTAKTYLAALFIKMDVHSRTQLAMAGLRLGVKARSEAWMASTSAPIGSN